MDAKPQRLRAMRIHNDENAYPAMPQGKTLHQRTKSTPALGTLLQAGAVKAGGIGKKVLGESNTNSKISQAAKDDSAINKKGQADLNVAIETVKPAAAHTRPATRLLASKSVSSTIIPSAAAAAAQFVTKQQPAETHAPTQEAAKKLTVKKSTKMLKDNFSHMESKLQPTERAGVPEVSIPAKSASTVDDIILAPDKIANVGGVPLPRHEVRKTETIPLRDEAVEKALSKPSNSTVSYPMPGSFVHEGNNGNVHALAHQANAMHLTHAPGPVSTRYPTQQPQQTQQQSYEPSYPQYVDEHDQYYYEEDEGYTTARSFGAAAESTGAITTVIQPKHTDKDKTEIAAAKMFVEATRPAEDVDDELWDISMVAEYSEDIFEYMHELEDRMSPNPRYMDDQQEIQWSMRSVLIDWLVQVHQRFNLLPETLFLTVNYIDRFLSCKVVSLQKLQLVGATAIFVASKYEEVNCPTVNEIVYMVDGGYSEQDIMKAERFMLSMLQFELGWPGPMSFLRRISKADDYDLETRTLAKYFLEITLMDERFVGSKPSFLAAGAHCLARLMLQKGEWSTSHVYYSDYTFAQLRSLLEVLVECCENPKVHHLAVFEKFCDKRYKKAAVFVAGQMAQGFRLPSKPQPLNQANIFANYGFQQPNFNVPVDPACC
ncbi:hypothetical protein K431DRAFT_106326 [Polychaeton citri CBS 116435]|uniref:Cyclin N-terminal domain-containing protein n=1 Tax=Polychaeton citri CBS 116435 TaxID=1314669 RepID=A0A9P4Q380_9PEZI|nr:hypothetical protein K431DRAFT_106326 [Polychaeton citri CBS 116435]